MEFKKLSDIIPIEYKDKAYLKVCSGYSDIYLLMWQPTCTLTYTHGNGMGIFENEKELFNIKATEFIDYASVAADLVLTPEGSFPWNLLEEILTDKSRWPRANALWCLCMQGIRRDSLESWIAGISCNTNLFIPCINDILEIDKNKEHVNLLFYIFKSEDAEKLFVIPQAKLGPMKDNYYEGEQADLCKGTTTYVVDLVNPGHANFKNILIATICADTFWLDYTRMKDFCSGKDLIVLHPQCCIKPWNNEFCKLKNELFDHNALECRNVQYISLNWAEGTRFYHNKKNEIRTSLSMIKCNNIENTYNILKSKDFQKRIAINQKNNLPFFFDYVSYSPEWCLYSFEQIIKIIISNTNLNSSNGTNHSYNHPTASEVHYFNKEGKKLSYNQCSINIIKELKDECSIDNDFFKQLKVCTQMKTNSCNAGSCPICQLDDFFARCFGEKTGVEELKFNQWHSRISASVYTDSELEDSRNNKKTKFVTLCSQLTNGLPRQFGKSKSIEFKILGLDENNISNCIIDGKYYALAAICNKPTNEVQELYNSMQSYRQSDKRIILYYFSQGNYIPFEDHQVNTRFNAGSLTNSKINGVKLTSFFATLIQDVEKLLGRKK